MNLSASLSPLFWIFFACGSTGVSIETKSLYIDEPIHLNWKIDDPLTPFNINFYCNKNGNKKALGVWTRKEGFTPDPFFSTNVDFKKSKGNILLILVNPISNDYDATYICEVSHDSGHDTLTQIQIKLTDPRWIENTGPLKTETGNDVTFVFKISYGRPVVVVLFKKYNHENTEEENIAYTLDKRIVIEDTFKGRIKFKQSKDGNINTFLLTVRDVKPDDEGVYSCQVIFKDGKMSNNAYKDLTVNSVSSKVEYSVEEDLNSSLNNAAKVFPIFYINVACLMFLLDLLVL